ncbi:MAG: SDR family oxidoreductase [Desulfobacteraceae bacterium]|nr:SDR family oxidoreductase [Desulfobacteraceae bacterium]
MNNSKQTALITGASSGIGRVTAMKLAEKGFHIIAVARRKKQLNELANQFQNITPKQVDLSNDGETKDICRYLSELQNPVSVLVNNAGYSIRGVLEDVLIEAARRLFEVNLFALMRVTQACLPGMRKLRTGTIINLSSIVGKFTFPGGGVYAASKYAVEGITDALRLELAPFGIRVVAMRPGPVTTEFNDVSNELSGDPMIRTDKDYKPIYQAAGAAAGKIFNGLSIPEPDLIAGLIVEAILSDAPNPVYSIGPLCDEFLGKRECLDDKNFHNFMLEKFDLMNLQV